MISEPLMVENIRVASRQMVRELGFMNQTLATTHYSPSVVHTLFEIEARGSMTAAQLAQVLGLEKSNVSRMLSKLVCVGEREKTPSAEDARTKPLRLTEKGRVAVQKN